MTGREMRHLISEISSIRAREDPSACVITLNPLLNTEEGRRFLSGQEREKALILIELFDWVVPLFFCFPNEDSRALPARL